MDPVGCLTGKSASFRSYVRSEAVCGREGVVIFIAGPIQLKMFSSSNSSSHQVLEGHQIQSNADHSLVERWKNFKSL